MDENTKTELRHIVRLNSYYQRLNLLEKLIKKLEKANKR